MMNVLLELYFKLPHDSSFGIISKIINRIAARIVKRILDRTVPNHFLKTLDKYPTGVNLEPREKEIVISLTSFPGRIADQADFSPRKRLPSVLRLTALRLLPLGSYFFSDTLCVS